MTELELLELFFLLAIILMILAIFVIVMKRLSLMAAKSQTILDAA